MVADTARQMVDGSGIAWMLSRPKPLSPDAGICVVFESKTFRVGTLEMTWPNGAAWVPAVMLAAEIANVK